VRGLAIAFELVAIGCATQSQHPPSERPQPAYAQELGDFEFRDERGRSDRPIHVWYARPVDAGPQPRILFILHGDSRTGRSARDVGASYAGLHRFIVVAPHFRQDHYPGDVYDLGGMVRGGAVQPREDWALLLIEHLFDHLRERWSLTALSYDIVGHSAGGQFVQRLVLFVPEARFRRAVASGPGTLAFPDVNVNAPYGLGGVAIATGGLERSLSREFVLVVGDRDVEEGPRPELVLAQGKNRLSRAFRLFAVAQEVAVEHGVPLEWRLRVVHGLDHSPLETLALDFEEILR
jgi:poly(3-hydroxybutyrate) depolymerase